MDYVNKIMGKPSPYMPLVLESIRRADRILAKDRKVVLESQEPSTGCFYVVRYPTQWKVIPFLEKEMGWVDHTDAWEDYIVPILANKWNAALGRNVTPDLENAPYAFPRGRVTRTEGARGVYLINHGGDLWDKAGKARQPYGVSRKSIEHIFSVEGISRDEIDSHEKVIPYDRSEVYGALGIK